jgi:hypothetical protein
MEVVFGNSLGRPQSAENDGSYESKVRAIINDAVDHEISYLAHQREENQNYYYGNLPLPPGSGEDEEYVNRSSIVSTDARDTVMSILPSLIRIFAASEHTVYFQPRTDASTDMADQATDYVKYVFWEDNDGFMVLHSVFKDAMSAKYGVVEVSTDNEEEVTEKTFQNITQEQYQFILSEAPDVEVVELEGGEDGTIDLVTFRYLKSKPMHKCEAFPPEEFRIARTAKDIHTAQLIGRERLATVSELVKKGLDEDFLADYLTNSIQYSEERYIRNPATTESQTVSDGIQWGEYYIRIDADGDGIDELRYICTVGNNFEIVHDVVVQDHKYAVFSMDPRPHTVVGDDAVDLTKDVQKIKTNMLRGNLDNLAEANNPRTVINELLTNVEDALNDEVGAVIRTRGDPNTAVAFSKVPYVGADILENMAYMDNIRASRTGISEASKGLDPKALQSTALTGIDAIVSGAQERIELIAYLLANTGMKRMFKLLLREITNNPNPERTIQLRGKWVTVNPSLFDADMKVGINPTLGKGTDIIRLQALQEVKQTQMMIIEKWGPDNPSCGPIEFMNTMEDLLAIANIKNTQRYFKKITPEIMEQIAAAPKEPDPAAVLAQAELEKVKKDVVVATAEQETKQNQLLLTAAKDKADDDFRRDKLMVDSWVKLLEVADASAQEYVEQQNQVG